MESRGRAHQTRVCRFRLHLRGGRTNRRQGRIHRSRPRQLGPTRPGRAVRRLSGCGFQSKSDTLPAEARRVPLNPEGESHRFRAARRTSAHTSAPTPKTTTAMPTVQMMSYIAIPKLLSCHLNSLLHQTYPERREAHPPCPKARTGFSISYFQTPLRLKAGMIVSMPATTAIDAAPGAG